MKTIEVDEDLYRYIASQTKHIGESASDILRRLLGVEGDNVTDVTKESEDKQNADSKPQLVAETAQEQPQGIVVSKDAGKNTSADRVKQMRALLISDEFASSKKAIDRFMQVLSALYAIDQSSFAEAAQVKGRTRVYFADNEDVLLASGKTTKPRAIPGTPFWVITNNNTNRKRQMVDQVMTKMGFQADLIEKVCGSI